MFTSVLHYKKVWELGQGFVENMPAGHKLCLKCCDESPVSIKKPYWNGCYYFHLSGI